MKGKRLLISVLSLSLILSLILFPSIANAEEPQYGGTLRIGYYEVPEYLDSMMSGGVQDDIARFVVETLVTADENLQPQPELAKSWEYDNENLVWTFYLRENVEFHNGKEMTSEDVVASANRFLNYGEAGGQFQLIEEVEAVDEYTVNFHLEEDWGTLPESFGRLTLYFGIQPKEIMEEYGEDMIPTSAIEDNIGTGPYKLVDVQADEEYRFERFENYSSPEGEPSGQAGAKNQYLDEIVVIPIPDESARTSAVLTGEVDISARLNLDELPRFEADSNVEPVFISPGRRLYYKFDMREGPFAGDKYLREAVRAAVYPEELLATQGPEDLWSVDFGIRNTTEQWMYEKVNDADIYYPNDKEYAEMLVEMSNYDGEEIIILVSPEMPVPYNTAPVMAETLEDIGLNVELRSVDRPTYTSYYQEFDEWDLKGTHTGSVQISSTIDYAVKDRGGNYWPGVEEDKWEYWLSKLLTEDNIEDQQYATAQLFHIHAQDAVEMYIGEVNEIDVTQSHVRNPSEFFQRNYMNIWLDQ